MGGSGAKMAGGEGGSSGEDSCGTKGAGGAGGAGSPGGAKAVVSPSGTWVGSGGSWLDGTPLHSTR